MRLIKLSANKPSFKTVEFKETGPSLIVGIESNPGKKDRTKTYNGVGKSLIIRILHFCLGSNKINEFAEKLPDWEFSLTLKLQEKTYVIRRSTEQQDIIWINDQKNGLAEYKKLLQDSSFFNLPETQVTFRSLINRFLRPNKACYTSASQFISDEKEFSQLVNNAFLLGIDPSLILKKRDLRETKVETQTKKDNFKKDEVLKEFFSGTKDPQIELLDIEEQINKLEKSLKAFDVAEDYHQIRSNADAASRLTRELENQSFVIKNTIGNIESSLKLRPDIPKELVVSVYEEAKFKFTSQVTKELDEVIKFHGDLIEKRRKRLVEEKERLSKKLISIEQQRVDLSKKIDEAFKYLNTHRALDEFLALNTKLTDLVTKSQRIRDYKNMVGQYEAKIQNLNLCMTEENLKTEKYLTDHARDLLHINGLFRSFAKEFYSDKTSGISVNNNVGDNQLRLDINIKIQDDASDGINEVKIFCFDLCLLLLKMNHAVHFLFHDSRLFSDMDTRQLSTLFRLVNQVSSKEGLQYIASINQNHLSAIQTELKPEEYKKFIEDNVILELTDASAESKLLGIQVDLDLD